MTRTFYDLIEVSECASAEVIDAAWKAMLRKWHPDVNRSVNAADITRALNQAHEILSDPVARARYDQELAERRRVITIPARPVPQGAGLSVTMSAGDASLMFFHTFSPTPWS